jgi:hypothetical protein
MDLRFEKKLAPSLRDGFWDDFLKVIQDEFALFRSERLEPKKNLYDVRSMNKDMLLRMTDLLGVPFDARVDDSIEFLREEVRSIPFKIKYKGTVKLYRSFFRALKREGGVFLYFFKTSSNTIVQDKKDMLVLADLRPVGDVKKPIFQLPSGEYTGVSQKSLELDSGYVLDVESAGEIWKLDSSTSSVTSNHLGLEFFADRIIMRDGKKYLMTVEYLDYVDSNSNFSRRVKEVHRIGTQLNLITDRSGALIEMIEIEAKSRTDPLVDVSSVFEIGFFRVGSGIPSLVGLGSPVAKLPILFDNRRQNLNWFHVATEYPGLLYNDILLHTSTPLPGQTGLVDGINSNFSGVLPHAPLQPKTVKIQFGTDELVDNGRGFLTGEKGEGTIDYATGAYTLDFDFNFKAVKSFMLSDNLLTTFAFQLDNTSEILADQTWMEFVLGGKKHLVHDVGNTFTHPLISSGTINRTTGMVNITFTQPLPLGEPVVFNYLYPKAFPPSEDIYGTLFSQNPVEITEAAIYKEDGTLIGTAEFPPLEFKTKNHHVSLGFLIKRGTL